MKKINGFTLIELMLVVAIIGILAAIATSAYMNYSKKANDSACLSEMKTYASLYVSEKVAETGDIANLPIDPLFAHCIFTAPSDLSANTLTATAPKGSGKTITCDVNGKAVCEIN